MDLSGCSVSEFQIAVNVGGLDLAPFPVFLYQRKQWREFRTIGITPFLQQDHRRIICCFSVGCSDFHNRQFQGLIQILLESFSAAVCSNGNVANEHCDLISDTLHLLFCLLLMLFHQVYIHRHAVVFHQP